MSSFHPADSLYARHCRSVAELFPPLLIVVIAVLILAVVLWTRTERGALAIDRLKPRIPILGDIWLKAQIAQFVRTLSTLLSGGTPLVSSLQTSSAAIGSRLVALSVEKAADRVREGESLHVSLAETRLIPDLALEMIEVGEASGALAAMLTSVAEFYEEDVNTRLERTLIWVQPAILGVMAVVVFFIAVSLYLPPFSPGRSCRGLRLYGYNDKQSDASR